MKSLVVRQFQQLAAAFLFVFFGLISGAVFAAQQVAVEDGKSYQIKVSTNELTRIVVKQGRIEKAWANTNAWRLEPDKSSGEIFIRGVVQPRKAFSFFIKDSFGNTYTLVAQPFDVPSETVELEAKTRKLAGGATSEAANQTHVVGIKNLLRDMASGKTDGYFCKEMGEEVPLWQEAKISLLTQCDNGFLQGDMYVLNNVSSGDMVLSEKEFANFGQGVLAVALEHQQLKAGQGTRLYIVRGMPNE